MSDREDVVEMIMLDVECGDKEKDGDNDDDDDDVIRQGDDIIHSDRKRELQSCVNENMHDDK